MQGRFAVLVIGRTPLAQAKSFALIEPACSQIALPDLKAQRTQSLRPRLGSRSLDQGTRNSPTTRTRMDCQGIDSSAARTAPQTQREISRTFVRQEKRVRPPLSIRARLRRGKRSRSKLAASIASIAGRSSRPASRTATASIGWRRGRSGDHADCAPCLPGGPSRGRSDRDRRSRPSRHFPNIPQRSRRGQS